MRMPVGSGRDEKDDADGDDRGDDRPDFQQAEETRIGVVRCLHFLLRHRFSPFSAVYREQDTQRPAPESAFAPVLATRPAMLKCGFGLTASLCQKTNGLNRPFTPIG
jgi:hypothetical protein